MIWVASPPGQWTGVRIAPGVSVVGRAPDGGICLPFDQVSRHHAEIDWSGQRLRMRDLGSGNGTTVNGRPVHGWVDVDAGDVIRFADVEAIVETAAGRRVGSVHEADRPEPPWPEPPHRSVPVSTVPVFISHSSEDKATARAIAPRTTRRPGPSPVVSDAGVGGCGSTRWASPAASSGTAS
jgi:pSer/pThr/pTyr-binding forkhead associated (FHA) protein